MLVGTAITGTPTKPPTTDGNAPSIPAATITTRDDDTVDVVFDQPQQAIAPGQACVMYQGESVLGGGWIE